MSGLIKSTSTPSSTTCGAYARRCAEHFRCSSVSMRCAACCCHRAALLQHLPRLMHDVSLSSVIKTHCVNGLGLERQPLEPRQQQHSRQQDAEHIGAALAAPCIHNWRNLRGGRFARDARLRSSVSNHAAVLKAGHAAHTRSARKLTPDRARLASSATKPPPPAQRGSERTRAGLRDTKSKLTSGTCS
jgi:hypothetical protein